MAHFNTLRTLNNSAQPQIVIEWAITTNIVPLSEHVTGFTNKIKASLRGDLTQGVPRIPTWQDWLGYRKEKGCKLAQNMQKEVSQCLRKLGLEKEYIVNYVRALEQTFGSDQDPEEMRKLYLNIPGNTRVFTILGDSLFEFVPGNHQVVAELEDLGEVKVDTELSKWMVIGKKRYPNLSKAGEKNDFQAYLKYKDGLLDGGAIPPSDDFMMEYWWSDCLQI